TRAVTTMPASKRPRRLRANEAMRRLVRETRLDPSRLVAPLFIISGRNRRQEITSLKGHARLSPDLPVAEAHRLARTGIGHAVRSGLDAERFTATAVMAYASKHASVLYGPFREAAGSTPSFGDRKSYQMDPANAREAMRELQLDADEGADILMVKPAITSLDL